ncbi:MAG: sigma-70 family RNA polymerase sigma factor [Bacteroidales bacterium]
MKPIVLIISIASQKYNQMTDAQKKQEIEKWVDDYTDDLYTWAYHKTSDKEVARDLTQDTFLAALQGFDNYKGTSSPKTWLFAILKNKIVDYYRKNLKEKVVGSYDNNREMSDTIFDKGENWAPGHAPLNWETDDSNLLDNVDFVKILKRCLEMLPLKWSLALKYKFFSEKQGVEICQELEVTPSNYWQMLHRGKLQMRECIENNWFKK